MGKKQHSEGFYRLQPVTALYFFILLFIGSGRSRTPCPSNKKVCYSNLPLPLNVNC